MFYRYDFESEVYPGLSRIPLHVRMKLDKTGMRLWLKVWLAFSMEERWALCHLPVETEEERTGFSSYLAFLTRRYTGKEPLREPPGGDFPWEDVDQIHESVCVRSEQAGAVVALSEWARWNPYERYALYKLAISKNEPEKFNEALREFRERTCPS